MASMCNYSSTFKLILGSSSLARRQILSDMGYEFTVMCADIDEEAIRREKPEELVQALAEAKADAIKLNLRDGCADRDSSSDRPTFLITSDQVKVSKGMIRERPRSADEAREFIKAYSGDRAFAVNYVLVTNLSTGVRKGGWDKAEIDFHHIPDWFIEEVVKEGGMTCVAGGLRLTHPSVLPFIKQLVGTADSVRGLPRELTEKLIRESIEAMS
ncbi:7-methyl-GTP pyrophosphatase-like [Lolium rigidum]|uniref:7-methyl-GTP pyrophosphatase-like n=1 Tax=Lolium rigidum TaxID=89674 RepID=UPI001F5DB1D4|nr:7-methyl-GTP pyrophosphatase-like [Lolium rigidum]